MAASRLRLSIAAAGCSRCGSCVNGVTRARDECRRCGGGSSGNGGSDDVAVSLSLPRLDVVASLGRRLPRDDRRSPRLASLPAGPASPLPLCGFALLLPLAGESSSTGGGASPGNRSSAKGLRCVCVPSGATKCFNAIDAWATASGSAIDNAAWNTRHSPAMLHTANHGGRLHGVCVCMYVLVVVCGMTHVEHVPAVAVPAVGAAG